VWAEPSVVEAAAYEFAQTEEFLQAAESITDCDYVWTRYDILCLPPSFPYGGVSALLLDFFL
jgi:leukotriene-A4 hydrolase